MNKREQIANQNYLNPAEIAAQRATILSARLQWQKIGSEHVRLHSKTDYFSVSLAMFEIVLF